MSAPKSTHSSFIDICRKLKMDETKTPRDPRALKSCFATVLFHRAGAELGCAGCGHSGAVQAGEELPSLCHCLHLGLKIGHSQLGGDARGLCSLCKLRACRAQAMAARGSWSRGKLFHVICNNQVDVNSFPDLNLK